MSRQNSADKKSPVKHKGMKSSLLNQVSQNLQSYEGVGYHPQRIYVRTTNENTLPNVLPYIDNINSQYSNNPNLAMQATSEYVPSNKVIFTNQNANKTYQYVNTRENNHIYHNQTNYDTNIRLSPLNSTNFDAFRGQNTANFTNTNRTGYVPPPPESFLITQQTPQHFSNLAVTNSNKNFIQAPTMVHNVKRTFIPQHIINEIPIYAETNVHKNESNEESQQVLMGFYEKLYEKYQNEKDSSQGLKHTMNQMNNEIMTLRAQLNALSNDQRAQQQTSKRIDQRKLSFLLQEKWNRVVDQVISRRKNSCLQKLGYVFQNNKSVVRIKTQVRDLSGSDYQSYA